MNYFVINILIWFFSYDSGYKDIKSGQITNGNFRDSIYMSENKCTECHNDYASNKVLHPPAESCDNCHQSNGKEHPASGEKCFDLAQAMPELCYNCHEPKNTKTSKHPPADRGECLTCHSPHSSENKALLTANSASELCSMCHEINLAEKKSVHLPVKEGRCVYCHDPHQSDQSKLLKKESRELCLSCHNKAYKSTAGTIENIGQTLKKGNYIHGAIEGDGCLSCHFGHSSEKTRLLIDNFPSSTYNSSGKEGYAICFSCHDSQLMESEKSSSATGFRNGDKNIHFLHLNGAKSRSCIVCHNVHGSPNQHLINNEVPFGNNWTMKINYEATENGGGCLPGCHQEEKYDRVNPIITETKVIGDINSQVYNVEADLAEQRKFEENLAKAKAADEEAKRLAEGKNNAEIIIENQVSNSEHINPSITDTMKTENNSVTSMEEENDGVEEDESEIIKLNSIKYDTDSITINKKFEKELIKVAKSLIKNPDWKVEVQGYTDDVGSELYNIELSLKRAKKAKAMLINEGISADRISTVGYGESRPVKSNETEKGRLLNRRIEFKFIYK